MAEKVLSNDINVKDENRLTNAVNKLTSDQGGLFTMDLKAVPAIVCGVEENQTDSTIDMITAKRDLQGVNRLCVSDIASLPRPFPSNKQRLFNSSQNFDGGVSADRLIFYSTLNETLYINLILYTDFDVQNQFNLKLINTNVTPNVAYNSLFLLKLNPIQNMLISNTFPILEVPPKWELHLIVGGASLSSQVSLSGYVLSNE